MVPPHFVAAPWQGKFFSDLMQPSPTKGENKLGDKKRKEFPTASRTQKAKEEKMQLSSTWPPCVPCSETDCFPTTRTEFHPSCYSAPRDFTLIT